MASSILVIRLGALGDIFLASAAFQAIRRHHAGERIVFLTAPAFASLAKSMPWFDEVWTDEKPRGWQIGKWLALRRRLRAGGFKRVYDLQGNDRTGFYFKLMGPGRPEWVGKARGCSHPRPDYATSSMHASDWHLLVASVGGVLDAGPADLSWLDGEVADLAPAGRFVILVPGCSPHRPEKRWPAERYAELALRLERRGMRAVAVGTAVDRPGIAVMRGIAPGIVDLSGRTSIGQLAALARRAEGAVGNDTGPTFIVAAAGAPTLTLMSKVTDPVRMAPRGSDAGWLKRDKLADLSVGEVEAALRLRA